MATGRWMPTASLSSSAVLATRCDASLRVRTRPMSRRKACWILGPSRTRFCSFSCGLLLSKKGRPACHVSAVALRVFRGLFMWYQFFVLVSSLVGRSPSSARSCSQLLDA
eukprot:2470759-Pleurochrysis_carterae.AAC.1